MRSTSHRWLGIGTCVGLAMLLLGSAGDRPEDEVVSAASDTDTIPFDHTIHVGQYGMQCLACHVDADKSTTAGIPSLRKCMGCHKFVAKDKPAIQALAKLYDDGEVPKWRRVHDLPDYVYFSHRMHVTGARLDCSACHGEVAAMHTVVQQASLSMGWCLDCHERREASLDCVTCHQ